MFSFITFQVSWIRKKDLHILTVGKFAYTKDDRYSTVHLENSDDWTLKIRYPVKEDEGIYECQVSTVPKISLKVQLNVVGKSSVSFLAVPKVSTLWHHQK